MAEVAHVLHTPLNVLGELDPIELLAWHKEAARIASARNAVEA